MRVLVAGVGNIFLGDDAFGVEVVNRLAAVQLPAGVEVEDFGIRGMHLAYQLLDGYDALLLVDAMPRGKTAGTITVLEPDAAPANASLLDAHGMEPDAVLAMIGTLAGQTGGRAPQRIFVVGCEPAHCAEGIGLSPPVAAATDEAVPIIRKIIDTLIAEGSENVATTHP
jgi:hydrogenase maturation protease